MNEKQFEQMDEHWMRSTKEMREKKVSDGMLKGFSMSVERRITGAGEEAPKHVRTLA